MGFDAKIEEMLTESAENQFMLMTSTQKAEQRIKNQGGIWGEEGWVVKGDLNLWDLFLSVLPKIKSVGRDFYCSYNELTSLINAPKTVGGDFWCYDNPLKSLTGLPDKIGGKFYCDVGLSFPKEEIILLIKAHPRNLKEIVKEIKWI